MLIEKRRWKILVVTPQEESFLALHDLLVTPLNTKFSVEWEASAHAAIEKMMLNTHDACLVDDTTSGLIVEVIKRGGEVPLILLANDEAAAVKGDATDYVLKNELSAVHLERVLLYNITQVWMRKATQEKEKRSLMEQVQIRTTADQAQLLQQVKMSEERLRLTLAAAPIVLFTLNRDGLITEAAGKGLEALVKQTGELLGRSVFEVFAGASHVTQDIRLALLGEHFASRIELHDLIWEANYAPLRDSDEKVTGVMVVATDITQRTQTEATLNKHVDQLTTLRLVDYEMTRKLDFEYVLDIALDAALRMSSAESGFIGLLEGDQLQLVCTIGYYPTKEGIPNLNTGIIARVIRQQQGEYIPDVQTDPDYVPNIPRTRAQIAIPLVSRNGMIGVLNLETPHAAFFSVEVFDMLKLLTARVAVAIENARLFRVSRMQLTELEARNRELDAYSYTIAHDLKAPLNLMVGYSSALLRHHNAALPEQAQDYLQGIKAAAMNMGRMIEQLLKLAQLRDARAAAVRVDINEVVTSALTRFKDRIDLHHITIDVASDLPSALGHAPWIEEVFANLVGNAIKYMGENNQQPRIQIRGQRHENQARYEVRDNGIGIDPDNQTRLFEMFTRVNEVEVEGLGLGLSIVHRIVSKLNGEVGVESTKGEGSAFWFTLPVPE